MLYINLRHRAEQVTGTIFGSLQGKENSPVNLRSLVPCSILGKRGVVLHFPLKHKRGRHIQVSSVRWHNKHGSATSQYINTAQLWINEQNEKYFLKRPISSLIIYSKIAHRHTPNDSNNVRVVYGQYPEMCDGERWVRSDRVEGRTECLLCSPPSPPPASRWACCLLS